MTLARPPAFADLAWHASDTSLPATANATPDFWTYWRAAKSALRDIGISVKPDRRDRWIVSFDRHRASEADVDAGMARVREILHNRDAAMSDAQRVDEERRREWEAGRPAREAAEAERVADIDARVPQRKVAAQTQARELLARWGEFASQKSKLANIVTKASADVTWEDLNLVDKASRDTTKKASLRLREGDLTTGGVDWHERLVVAAVEHLTAADSDHAGIENNRGWSRADSSTGHWCAAELGGENHVAALKVARTIVGRYERQLSAARVPGLSTPVAA